MDTKDKRLVAQEDIPASPDLDVVSTEDEGYDELDTSSLQRIGGPLSDRSSAGPLSCDACHKAVDKLYQADSKFWQCKKPHGNLCINCWGNTSHCPKCGDQVRALPRPKKATPVAMPPH